MKITKIVPGRFKKEYVTLVLEPEGTLKIHEELVVRFGLKEGLELDPARFEALSADASKKEAAEYALMFLSYRARSEREMSDRLKRKGYAPEVIQSVLADLKDRRLLDDKVFAKDLAENRLRGKFMGGERVRQDLIRKGVERSVAETALSEARDAEGALSEDERCYQALARRRKQVRETDFRALHRQLYGYLARRGFHYDTIEKALQRLKREERFQDQSAEGDLP